jgi:hypothetical protein
VADKWKAREGIFRSLCGISLDVFCFHTPIIVEVGVGHPWYYPYHFFNRWQITARALFRMREGDAFVEDVLHVEHLYGDHSSGDQGNGEEQT